MDFNLDRSLNPGSPTPRSVVTTLGILVAGYFVLAGCMYLFDAIALRSGQTWMQFVGLIVDIGLIAGMGKWLQRRGHPLSVLIGPVVALLLIFLFFTVIDWYQHGERASFCSIRNVQTMAVQSSTIAVAALGMTVIIIAGGIDLSAGTALALCATVLAYGLKGEWGVTTAIAACLGTGLLTGAINGTLTSMLGVVPFIITLGTMTIYQGVGKYVSKELTIRPAPALVPEWLSQQFVTPVPKMRWLWYPLVPNFATGVWLAILLAILLAGVLYLTVFGRHVFAIGSNETAARLSGINITRTKIMIYALAGLFVGTAGMYQFARLSQGSPTDGAGLELRIIAAVVIGGGSLTGGRGSVAGTLIGAAMMLVIGSGCTALGLPNLMQDIILGAIIVIAVTLDQFRRRRLFR